MSRMHSYHSFHNFDVDPCIRVKGFDGVVRQGYTSLQAHFIQALAAGKTRFCLDLYPNVEIEPILDMLRQLPGMTVLVTDEARKSTDVLASELEPYITDDRVFGKMIYLSLEACFDAHKAVVLRQQIADCQGALTVVGVGAGQFIADADEHFFWDINRWEIQLRYRRGAGTWLLRNTDAPQLTKYKVGFFIEWRLADRHKERMFDRADYWVDANDAEQPRWLPVKAFDAALRQASHQPFHMQAYFDSSVWGGQWMKAMFGLDNSVENYGWAFDGVPEENALKFDFGGITATFPAVDLVRRYPEQLLGTHVYGRFGAEFPIRFDFLDTYEGGNLSLQVHPLTTYIQENFGMHYTQDESYYILDADENSCVYLGLKPGVDPNEMYEALKIANAGGAPFDAEKYVNRFPVKKHDHVLIPAGTVHCSGKNTTVLEISATPYIFTFKLWDWGRVGLDGIPRPVHLEHGLKNIQFDRDTDWVTRELLHREHVIRTEAGGQVEMTGLHALEFIQTERYTVDKVITVPRVDSVMVVNLVEGAEASIVSEEGRFEPMTIHYGETFVVPADAGQVSFHALPGAGKTMLMTAFVR